MLSPLPPTSGSKVQERHLSGSLDTHISWEYINVIFFWKCLITVGDQVYRHKILPTRPRCSKKQEWQNKYTTFPTITKTLLVTLLGGQKWHMRKKITTQLKWGKKSPKLLLNLSVRSQNIAPAVKKWKRDQRGSFKGNIKTHGWKIPVKGNKFCHLCLYYVSEFLRLYLP